MKPRERRDEGKQDLFRSRLDQIIDMNHALVKLARAIDWRFLEDSFGAAYSDGPGMPPLIRVFDGRTMTPLREFLAFDAPYQQGCWLAAGDLLTNRRAEVVGIVGAAVGRVEHQGNAAAPRGDEVEGGVHAAFTSFR